MEITRKPLSEKDDFIKNYKNIDHYLKAGDYEDGSSIFANHVTYICEKDTDKRVAKIIWEPKQPDKHIYRGGNIKKRKTN